MDKHKIDWNALLKKIDLNEMFRKLYDRSAFATVRDRSGFSVKDISFEDFSEHVDLETQRKNAKEQFEYMIKNFYGTGDPDHFSFYELFYIFVFSAFAGSIIEELWCRASNGYWENRTSVVYGHLSFAEAIGGAFMTVLLYKDMDAPVTEVFAKAFVWGSVMEYIMSWGEETFTGYRSWDYSHRLFNINGRICFLYSCFWGFLGVLWIKLFYPIYKVIFERISKKFGIPMFWALQAFLLYDILISIMAKTRFTFRQDGRPAKTKLQKYLDRKFPDEVIIDKYPNSIRSKDGKIDRDTLNHTSEKAVQSSPMKAKLKEIDNVRENGGDIREVSAAFMDAKDEFKDYAGTTVRDMTSEVMEMATGAVKEKTDAFKDATAGVREKTEEVREKTEEVREKTEAVRKEANTVRDSHFSRKERWEAFKRALRISISIIHPGRERH